MSCQIPSNVRERLALMSCGLAGARWVESEQLHLTLRFIGDVDKQQQVNIEDALAEIEAVPFSMQLEGIGFFPLRGRPRVLWVGVAENPHLLQLQKRIESAVVRSGCVAEGRKFHPHLTLARLKDSPKNWIGRFLEQNALYVSEKFMVDQFQLYSSILGRSGAKHFVERSFSLGA
ncbi:MAG: RNA 2',3'-cyclic phosphodiesterase [Desulfobulbaceae bacterium]|nr:RNA 2',3'-cyclic phosphodiesterase [Desulfobulbaceae bacterium]